MSGIVDWRNAQEHALAAAELLSDPDPTPESVAKAQAFATTAIALLVTRDVLVVRAG